MAERGPILVCSVILNVFLLFLVATQGTSNKSEPVALGNAPVSKTEFEILQKKLAAQSVQLTDIIKIMKKDQRQRAMPVTSVPVTSEDRIVQEIQELPYPDCSSPRLIFVDLGANCGNSYTLWLSELLGKLPLKATMQAYLFEFNPRFFHRYLEPLVKKDPRVTLMKAAAHVQDGQFTAYIDKREDKEQGRIPCVAKRGAMNPSGASSLVADMPRAGKPINVSAINVPNFIDTRLCRSDEIHVKMDIEGFEYPLLTAMIQTKVHCMVKRFYIEFHFNVPEVEFMGKLMPAKDAANSARELIRECSHVEDWF